MPWKIVSEGEVWRLILSLYITHGFITIVINSIAQMIIGFLLESMLGPLRMAGFYFAVGISANIFGAITTDWYAAGPEPMLFGQLGGIIAMYLFYWDYIKCHWCKKVCGCCGLIVLILIGAYLVTALSLPYEEYTNLLKIDHPDTFGCIGGFIFGLFFSWVFLPSSSK